MARRTDEDGVKLDGGLDHGSDRRERKSSMDREVSERGECCGMRSLMYLERALLWSRVA